MKKRVTALLLCMCLIVTSLSMLSAEAATTGSNVPLSCIATVDGDTVTVTVAATSDIRFGSLTFKYDLLNGIECTDIQYGDVTDEQLYDDDDKPVYDEKGNPVYVINPWLTGALVDCNTLNEKETPHNAKIAMIGSNGLTAKSGKVIAIFTFDKSKVTNFKVSDIVLEVTVAKNTAGTKDLDWFDDSNSENNKVVTTLAGSSDVAVSSVSLDKTAYSTDCVAIADKEYTGITLTATVLPDDATDKSLTWSTSDATVATVTPSADGNTAVVKALKLGTATITVTSVADTTKKATCTVTVAHKQISKVQDGSPATCTEGGKTVYYQCECGQLFSDAEGKTPIDKAPADSAALGHDYKAVFTWAADNKSATAKLVCQRDTTHVITDGVSVEMSSTVTTPAGCTTEGKATYTATATYNGTPAVTFTNSSESKTNVVIPATGHELGKTVEETDSTCQVQGHIAYVVCKNCGKMFSDSTFKTEVDEKSILKPLADHDWNDWTVDVEATEEKEGHKYRTCKTEGCTEKEEKVIDKLDHVHVLGDQVPQKDAKCGVAGTKAYYECTKCHNKFLDNEAKIPVSDTDLVIPALSHLWDNGTQTLAPTCSTVGTMHYVCQREGCTGTKDEEIAINPNAHTWDKGTVTTEATCSSTGVRTFHCLNNSDHVKTETIDIDPDAHDYDDGVVTKEENCTEKGTKKYTCKHNSEHFYEEDIPVDPSKHVWNDGMVTKAPTCSEKGSKTVTCTKCNTTDTIEIAIDPDAHDWDEGTVTTDPTCCTVGTKTYTCKNNSDHKRTEDVAIDANAHKWSETGTVKKEATCTSKGIMEYTCENGCGQTRQEDIEIDPNAHDWGEWETTTAATCITKGEEKRVCKLCKAEETRQTGFDSANHFSAQEGNDWEKVEVTVEPTCKDTGIREYTCKCNTVIKEVIPVTNIHTPGTHTLAVDPDCHKAGNIEFWTCSVCEKNFKDEALTEEVTETALAQLEHEWDEGVVTKEPTYTEKGTMLYTCVKCHDTKEEDINPLIWAEYDCEDAEWTKGSETGATLKAEVDFTKFTDGGSVKVDDITVDADKYTAISGSTIITFKTDYLETLALGAHDIEIVFNDGSAKAKLTIKEAEPEESGESGESGESSGNGNNDNDSPKTGDNNQIAIAVFLMILSAAGIATVITKKEENR